MKFNKILCNKTECDAIKCRAMTENAAKYVFLTHLKVNQLLNSAGFQDAMSWKGDINQQVFYSKNDNNGSNNKKKNNNDNNNKWWY